MEKQLAMVPDSPVTIAWMASQCSVDQSFEQDVNANACTSAHPIGWLHSRFSSSLIRSNCSRLCLPCGVMHPYVICPDASFYCGCAFCLVCRGTRESNPVNPSTARGRLPRLPRRTLSRHRRESVPFHLLIRTHSQAHASRSQDTLHSHFTFVQTTFSGRCILNWTRSGS